MLIIEDMKVLVSAYRFIERNCDLIDEFVYKHAVNFGPSPEYCSTYDVTNNIIDLMERKNRLINFKLMIDELVNSLSVEERKIIVAKMRYNLSMVSACKVLQLPSLRTAFRKMKSAMENLTELANNSKYQKRLSFMLNNEEWLTNLRERIVESAC